MRLPFLNLPMFYADLAGKRVHILQEDFFREYRRDSTPYPHATLSY
jgi:hypothetical protein